MLFRQSIFVASAISLYVIVASCSTNCNTSQCKKGTLRLQSEGWQDFIGAVVSVPFDQTNIVYYAGTSNDVFVLVHQTNATRRFWNFNVVNLEKSIWREFSDNPRNWIVIKPSGENTLNHWNWRKEIEDFVQRRSEQSALVMPCSTFYKVDCGRVDDNVCVSIVNVFSVEATLCDALKIGDKICTEQLYDGCRDEIDQIVSEAKRSGNSIIERRLHDRRLCFAYWNKGKFVSPQEMPNETFFIIDNEIIAPFEVFWNLSYDGLIHFDENVAVQAYKRRVLKERQTCR